MLKLNIIPKSLKQEIKIKQINHNLENVYGIILVSLILALIILTTAKGFLQNNFIKTVQNTSLLTKSTENYTKQVKLINTKVNLIDQIQKDHTEWSYLINYFSNLDTPDIVFNRISVNKEKNNLEVNGFATKRDSIIELKETLENSTIFKSVNFPISNFLQKENINFQFNAIFENYEFKKL